MRLDDFEEYREYVKIFHDSHILLLQTKAECSGIVFSEAASFGLPSYTHLTGGTGDYWEVWSEKFRVLCEALPRT